jgi:beta-phosphoglucomutase
VAYINKMTPNEILPGVLKFLEDAHKKNIKIALGSASKNAIPILEKLGIINYFDALITGNDVVNAKPDPEVFLKGADALGLLPEECIVFEDAIAGVQAAKNGRMKCIGIGSKDVLGAADIVIDGFNDFSTNDAINI